MDDLQVKLAKWLIEQEPGLLTFEPAAFGRAASALSGNLGCMLAAVLIKAGPDAYKAGMKTQFERAHTNAVKTAGRAFEMADSPFANTRH